VSLVAAAPAATVALQPASDLPARQRSDLARAAAMLEGTFLRQLLKVMRETVPESSLFGESLGQSIYTQMFDESVADEVSKGEGMGLRPILLAQLGGTIARPPAAARQAAATLRRVAALAPQLPAPSAGGASPGQAASQEHGPSLGGVEFTAPARPEPVRLRDPDGKLCSPIAGSAAAEPRAARGAEVRAAGSGEVVASGPGALVIDHGNGLRTTYQGLGRVQTQVGDLVLRGQAVGSAGAEFRFQVLRRGQPVQGPALGPLFRAEPSP